MQKAYHFKYETLNNGPVNIYTIISSSYRRAMLLFHEWADRRIFPRDAYLYLVEVYITEIADIYAYKLEFTKHGSYVIRKGKDLPKALKELSKVYSPSSVIDVEVANVT